VIYPEVYNEERREHTGKTNKERAAARLLVFRSPQMKDNSKLWAEVLAQIELSVSKATFATWFKGTHINKSEDGIIHLGVPNPFVKDWLSKHFHLNILKFLRDLGGDVRSLVYVISKEEPLKEEGEQKIKNVVGELPLTEYYINKDDNLNPRYTFDNFIVGPFNELAYAAAQVIIKKPGISYNPLFVHGDTGHGKTHLIQSVGNKIKSQSPNKLVYYITSEKFTMDYVSSVQLNRANQFKEKYRKYDVFIMDDIQFLSNKEKTQEELFHLFNTLYENNKQIIFSSDRHPNYIPELEERLKSRFSAGMVINIPKPDHESRMAIVRAKARINGFMLADEAVDIIASTLEGNIRELEGVVNSIICQTQVKNRDLSLNEIRNIVKNNQRPKKNVSVQEVIKIVADYYNIEEASIYEKTRKKEIVKPRQLAMYILREDFNASYPSIGQKLGGRDHTTVIHSCEKIKNDLKKDPALSQEISQIRAML